MTSEDDWKGKKTYILPQYIAIILDDLGASYMVRLGATTKRNAGLHYFISPVYFFVIYQ